MSRRPNLADLRQVLSEHKAQTVTGVVFKPDHEPSHFELTATDVYVWVKVTVPATEMPLLCRLGAYAGGIDRRSAPPEHGIQPLEGLGIWAIPYEGIEVEVSIPDGDLMADPVITNTLSTGRVPAQLAENVLVIKHATVKIVAIGSDVTIDATATATGTGRVVLQGGSLDVARKTDAVQVTFPSGKFIDLATGLPNLSFTLSGTITGGTSKVKA